MRKFFSGFIDRYFHDEETIVLSLILLAAVLVLVTMGSVIGPLLAAIVIAYLLQGMVNALLRLGVPYLLSVVMVFTLFISGFMLLMLLVLPQAWGQLGRLINELPRLLSEGQALLMVLPEHYPNLVSEQQVQDFIRSLRGDLAMLGQHVVSYSISGLTMIVYWIVFVVLVPVLVFYMLKDKRLLVEWVAGLLPRHRPVMREIWQEMDLQVANYVRGKCLEILVMGVMSYVAFIVVGINYALLLAVLVGVSVLVPIVGVAVIVFPVAAVAYVQWGIGSEFATVVVIYCVLQLLDANLLVPVIYSETVNLHPVAIVAAVLVFGGFWGLAGVFFAIPLATLINAIFKAWPSHQSLSTPPPSKVMDRETGRR